MNYTDAENYVIENLRMELVALGKLDHPCADPSVNNYKMIYLKCRLFYCDEMLSSTYPTQTDTHEIIRYFANKILNIERTKEAHKNEAVKTLLLQVYPHILWYPEKLEKVANLILG